MCFRNKGIGSGRDFISGGFRNSAGEAYTSRYTYFSNLVARTRLLYLLAEVSFLDSRGWLERRSPKNQALQFFLYFIVFLPLSTAQAPPMGVLSLTSGALGVHECSQALTLSFSSQHDFSLPNKAPPPPRVRATPIFMLYGRGTIHLYTKYR